MNQDESEIQSPSGLMRRLIWGSIWVPTISFLIVGCFSYLTGNTLTLSEWKKVVFLTWLLVMLLLPVWAYRYRREVAAHEESPNLSNPSLFRVSSSRSPIEKWEQRSSRRLVRNIYLATILVPLIGVMLGYFVLLLIDIKLQHRDYMLIVLIYWLASLVTAAYSALRSRHGLKLN